MYFKAVIVKLNLNCEILWETFSKYYSSSLNSVYITDKNSILAFGSSEGYPLLMLTEENGKIDSTNKEISSFFLYQNCPNPFNPNTRIKFDVPEFSHVSVKVYDILGNEIYSLLDEEKSAGTYYLDFNGSNFASGIYFYKITAADYIDVKKMILIK